MTTAIAAVSLSSPVVSSPRFFRMPMSESLTQEKAKKGNEEKSDAANVKNRKSPAMLCIPVANMELELGNEMEKGVEEVEVEVEGDGYSVYSRKGKRGRRIDSPPSSTLKGVLTRVFDGHGGAKAAEFAAKHTDANIREEITRSGSDIQKAINNAYVKTDEEFLRRNNNDDVSGDACCVSALIYEGKSHCIQCWRFRAVISQGGVAEAITSVQRPSLNSERERIEDDAVMWTVAIVYGEYKDHLQYREA